MTFPFVESLKTGNQEIDDDHRELISRVNLISEVEKSSGGENLIDALMQFKNELAKHFRSEEEYLEEVQYPKRSSHAKHHAETLVALDRLIADVQHGEPIEGGPAHVCYHELISVLLLRDMQFINWLADHPEQGR